MENEKTENLTEENIEVRCETTFEIWDAIKNVLENAVNHNSSDDMPDMSIETDRG